MKRIIGTTVLGLCATLSPSALGNEGAQFFENEIRPLFAKYCYECHSADADRIKGGLRLDHTALIEKGGDSGALVDRETPDASRLLEALRYQNVDLQMPPDSKLPDEAIQKIERWVANGAIAPEDERPVNAAGSDEFDLKDRKENHWAWRPIERPEIPQTLFADWASQPIDHFIAKRMEDAGLEPAKQAAPAKLARRLFYDLTGLPPDPEAVAGYIANPSPANYESLVDAAIGSQEFGESWARKWLDLVRYAETMGHEFDYAIPNAWRYRDYVIRALNDDVPFDQFAMEHIAGDLIENPRLNEWGQNESAIGSAFFWLGQQVHSPVDVRGNQADLLANQIDVYSKTFQGLTVACARCHDHKFDAIPTTDFYSLYGIFASSRYHPIDIDPDADRAERRSKLRAIQRELTRVAPEALKDEAKTIGAQLKTWAAWRQSDGANADPEEVRKQALRAFATTQNIDPDALERLDQRLRDALQQRHPLAQAIERLADGEPVGESTTWTPAPNAQILGDFENGIPKDWFHHDEAFRDEESPERGTVLIGSDNQPIEGLLANKGPNSRALSKKIEGSISAPTFQIDHRYLHVLCEGADARFNVVVENHNLIRAPIYGGLKSKANWDHPRWMTFDLNMWQGDDAYFQVLDMRLHDLAGPGSSADSWFALYKMVASDQRTPPTPDFGALAELDGMAKTRWTAEFQKRIESAIGAWGGNTASPTDLNLIDGAFDLGLLRGTDARIQHLVDDFHAIERGIQEPTRIPGMVEGTPIDEKVFVRGNPNILGERAERGPLAALPETAKFSDPESTGRLELARATVSEKNPLTARVYVNRVWSHLFGRGIVPTVDDFGAMGQPPTHPDTLDWLADWFRTEADWSTKKLVRLLVTSSAYQLSSEPIDPERLREVDPTNQWLSAARVRRLPAESIRDGILKVSGSLNQDIGGPGVATHLTPFMQGRGRPGRSGPVDGEGRRSIYQEVRRNFLEPMMTAFDRPIPSEPVGARSKSNVPAQALILMNNPFVSEQCDHWADRLLSDEASTFEEQLSAVYMEALGREPNAQETLDCHEFLETQKQAYGKDPEEADRQAWSDLLHVVVNLKEFIYLQ